METMKKKHISQGLRSWLQLSPKTMIFLNPGLYIYTHHWVLDIYGHALVNRLWRI